MDLRCACARPSIQRLHHRRSCCRVVLVLLLVLVLLFAYTDTCTPWPATRIFYTDISIRCGRLYGYFYTDVSGYTDSFIVARGTRGQIPTPISQIFSIINYEVVLDSLMGSYCRRPSALKVENHKSYFRFPSGGGEGGSTCRRPSASK